jgi:hypothetical protein
MRNLQPEFLFPPFGPEPQDGVEAGEFNEGWEMDQSASFGWQSGAPWEAVAPVTFVPVSEFQPGQANGFVMSGEYEGGPGVFSPGAEYHIPNGCVFISKVSGEKETVAPDDDDQADDFTDPEVEDGGNTTEDLGEPMQNGINGHANGPQQNGTG